MRIDFFQHLDMIVDTIFKGERIMQSTKVSEEERNFYKLLNLWYSNIIDGQLAESTCRMYKRAIIHIKTFCSDVSVWDIDEELLQNVINEMCRQSYSKSTIDKVRIVMKRVVEYACA